MSAARFDDAWYASRGVGVARALVDNKDGTVADRNTGLVWVSDPSRCGGVFGTPGSPARRAFKEAADGCDQLVYAAHDDWRLPTLEELATVVDAGRSSPCVDRTFFPGCQSAQYWTSTSAAGGKPGRWMIDFAAGFVRITTAQDSAKLVRPVRGGAPAGRPRRTFVDNGNGTVTDTSTGLIWVRDPTAAGLENRCTWSEALRACAVLDYAGSKQWRLPNRNELASLVDYSLATPSINGTFFVVQSDGYWSSTSSAENAHWAWAVWFDDGSVASGDKNCPQLVRPVRSGG